jgi:aryl-alcohol dehydrogenase-like predicted oxidoreductase
MMAPSIGMSSIKRSREAIDAVNLKLTKEEEESNDKLYKPRVIMDISGSSLGQKAA